MVPVLTKVLGLAWNPSSREFKLCRPSFFEDEVSVFLETQRAVELAFTALCQTLLFLGGAVRRLALSSGRLEELAYLSLRWLVFFLEVIV